MYGNFCESTVGWLAVFVSFDGTVALKRGDLILTH